MEPNYIFGITKSLLSRYDIITQGCVIDSSLSVVKTGAPCIILSKKIEKNTIKRIKPKQKVLLPFPSNYNGESRILFSSPDRNIIVRELDKINFFDTIKTIGSNEVDEFNIDLDYVKSIGPLTLNINNIKYAKKILNKVINLLNNTFKDSTIFHSTFSGMDGDRYGAKAILSLTLINISQCIPIFSSNKVEGIMLQIAVNYPTLSIENDNLVTDCESVLLFSNNKHDLIDIDGMSLGIQFDNGNRTNIKESIKKCKKYFKNIGENSIKEVTKQPKETLYQSVENIVCAPPVKMTVDTSFNFE